MKKLRFFKCSDDHYTEKLVVDEVKSIECHCGKFAPRQLSAPRHFGNSTGKSPSSSYRR